MNAKQLSRRDFLRALGLGSTALLTSSGLASLLSSCTSQGEASTVVADAVLPTTGSPILATSCPGRSAYLTRETHPGLAISGRSPEWISRGSAQSPKHLLGADISSENRAKRARSLH